MKFFTGAAAAAALIAMVAGEGEHDHEHEGEYLSCEEMVENFADELMHEHGDDDDDGHDHSHDHSHDRLLSEFDSVTIGTCDSAGNVEITVGGETVQYLATDWAESDDHCEGNETMHHSLRMLNEMDMGNHTMNHTEGNCYAGYCDGDKFRIGHYMKCCDELNSSDTPHHSCDVAFQLDLLNDDGDSENSGNRVFVASMFLMVVAFFFAQ